MSLRSFLEEKEKEGQILHIKDQVSPRFEISSIIKAFDGGPILFFDKIKGHTTCMHGEDGEPNFIDKG